jgi:hypothetical protein
MLAEWLMERYDWDAVWFLGSNGLKRGPFRFFGPGTCLVGTWTGPDTDLLCVKECSTADEAETYLSPEGWTISHAAIRAWWKRISVDAVSRKSPYPCGNQHKESRNLKESQGGSDYDG